MDFDTMLKDTLIAVDSWLDALLGSANADTVAMKKEQAGDLISGVKNVFPHRIDAIEKAVDTRMLERFQKAES